MGALVIKNLPEPVHERLRLRAARNHRSVTKEAIALLEAAVRGPGDTPPAAYDPVDALFAAGEALAEDGVDFDAWAARSREAWR